MHRYARVFIPEMYVTAVKETIHDINKKHQNVNQHIASFISIDLLRKKMPAELNSSLLSDISLRTKGLWTMDIH